MPATYTVHSLSPQGSLDDEYAKTTATLVFQVVASEPTSLAHAMANASAPTLTGGVPAKGTNLPDTTGLPCVKRSWKFADQTRTRILATCEYDSTRTPMESPLSMPAVVSSSSEDRDESYHKDAEDKLARHTNGVPFDELPRRDTATDVFQVEKNVAGSVTYGTLGILNNKVNTSAMTIDGRSCAAGTVKASNVGLGPVQTMNGVEYRVLRSTLKYRPEKWEQKFESIGLVDINNKPIVDAEGNPVDAPWPLTAGGTKAATRATPGFEIVMVPYYSANLAPLV